MPLSFDEPAAAAAKAAALRDVRGQPVVERAHFKKAASQLEKDARDARRQEKYDAEAAQLHELLASITESECAQRETHQHRVRRKQDRAVAAARKLERDEWRQGAGGGGLVVREESTAAMAAAARAEAVALRKYREQQEAEAGARRAEAAAAAAALEARIVAADNAAAERTVGDRGAQHAAEAVALRRAWERQAAFAARQRGGGAGNKQRSAGDWAAVP